ncbi:MAG: DUF2892 domain-containing protein [Bradyrhizobium sp.]|uniref:DUF2892 domain-containing protein n=1 Tax=Bradyrhizobium denitrificans TaxID=2734912 RepID=A0ABS5GE74_9BRAD|nr:MULTISPECIES: DUF2892 domain-containing protein [Bradyrhizobium]RTL96339.1 MAG: DUF2892 domain-containing protein [Bradyrhizobiaceae bacterium]ABQ35769.1 putative membrane protein of unknown function [Bradyrhizobium sp. BTAi1]MBR1139640.1 DUF2892 domain-containing protein [Bradyrhizobium denitrificans]MCL8484298.1 DUF2892 domain-containing protein [Bradyrhizobium denitrificans]MDU0953636.1 DUF2892 domain-containing protein [Bradyrhizobium sp.]
MTQNIGKIDRLIRIIVGLAILSLTIIGPQTLWGLLGLIPLGTALIGWCPPYAMLGINTCGTKPGAAS